MRFRLLLLRRRGVPIPKHQLAFDRGLVGELMLEDRVDQALGRLSRIACWHPSGENEASVPPLHDATLVAARQDFLTLAGIERLSDERTGLFQVGYAQSWMLCAV